MAKTNSGTISKKFSDKDEGSYSLFQYHDMDGYPLAEVIDQKVHLSFRLLRNDECANRPTYKPQNKSGVNVKIYRMTDTKTHFSRNWFWGGDRALKKALKGENDKGYLENWSNPAFDDSDWDKMQVPEAWRSTGLLEFNGVIWHRKTVNIPTNWMGTDLSLSLGPICEEDVTWFNGEKIGISKGEKVFRKYHIPKHLVNPGKNTITVRVTDTTDLGGIWGKPEEVGLSIDREGKELWVPLAGQWRYNVGLDLLYYQNMAYVEHECIYDTEINEIKKMAIEFIDRTVKVGNTYVYWIVQENNDAVGPIPVRVWDPEVVWKRDKIYCRMEALAQRYSTKVAMDTFGYTSKGTPIKGLLVGNRDKLIALIGVVHASEAGPELIIPVLESLLASDSELLDKVGVAILPSSNPDSREEMARGCPWYLRKNPNGVDINRNFPVKWELITTSYNMYNNFEDSNTYRGPEPASELETQTIMKFIRKVKPSVVLSMHYLYSITGSNFFAPPFTIDKEYLEECRRLAEAYTRGMYPDEYLKVKCAPYGTGGSLPAWVYEEFGIPVFDQEAGRDEGETRRTQVHRIAGEGKTTPNLIKEYQGRHYSGLVSMMKALI